jgi:hypothetical protein
MLEYWAFLLYNNNHLLLKGQIMADERRVIKRRKFGYYMRVLDNVQHELIGYLSDISPRGFKLDSTRPLVVNRDYSLRLDLTPEVSDKSFIIFTARSKWSNPDPTDPNSFIQGFEIVNISVHDAEIFQHMVEKYGTNESFW